MMKCPSFDGFPIISTSESVKRGANTADGAILKSATVIEWNDLRYPSYLYGVPLDDSDVVNWNSWVYPWRMTVNSHEFAISLSTVERRVITFRNPLEFRFEM